MSKPQTDREYLEFLEDLEKVFTRRRLKRAPRKSVAGNFQDFTRALEKAFNGQRLVQAPSAFAEKLLSRLQVPVALPYWKRYRLPVTAMLLVGVLGLFVGSDITCITRGPATGDEVVMQALNRSAVGAPGSGQAAATAQGVPLAAAWQTISGKLAGEAEGRFLERFFSAVGDRNKRVGDVLRQI